ncbi:hypothetical protein OIU77_031287 [Salix suchowensis]|uniref:Uncharacterized protein n=1 Tax=Salix suchowensis TaxID=1278906 RepID=A0ABQ9BIJ7_9ROSI|nr:hypothetical protein OIU77_031287 [Salix suchowensis]
MTKIAIGSRDEAAQPDCLKALVVEFITTFLFVFAGVGSAMAADKLTGDALLGLFAVAVAHALVVAATISGGHISGGHLNPAVTIGLLFRWSYHCCPIHPLLDYPIVGIYNCLSPPQVSHRRIGYSSSHTCKWDGLPSRSDMGDCTDFLLAIHSLCHYCGPQEGIH